MQGFFMSNFLVKKSELKLKKMTFINGILIFF